MMSERGAVLAAIVLASGVASGQVASFTGGNLTGTATSQMFTTDGEFFDSNGAGLSSLTATFASGGTDSGLVNADGSVSGSASFSAMVDNAENGVSRIVVDAFAEARLDNLSANVFNAQQSVAIGPGGVPGNFLFIEVDRDTAFEFIVEILNPNEVSSSSITFSGGTSGTLLAGQQYELRWSIGAFASTNGQAFDDVRIRATLLLPGPGSAGVLAAAGLLAARRRR